MPQPLYRPCAPGLAWKVVGDFHSVQDDNVGEFHRFGMRAVDETWNLRERRSHRMWATFIALGLGNVEGDDRVQSSSSAVGVHTRRTDEVPS